MQKTITLSLFVGMLLVRRAPRRPVARDAHVLRPARDADRGERQDLDRRRHPAVGRSSGRRRGPDRGGRIEQGDPGSRGRGTVDRRRRTPRAARLHRHARALHRRRLPAVVGAAARRREPRRSSSRRIRAFAATVPKGTWITGGDWDHSAVGRGAARRARGSTPSRRPSGLDQPPRRAHGARQQRRAARPRASTRDDRRRRRRQDRARRAAASPTGVLKDNAMGLVDRVGAAAADAMSDRALDGRDGVRRRAGRHDRPQHGDAGTTSRRSRARAQPGRAAHAHLRRGAARRLGAPARRVPRNARRADGRGDDWLRIGALKGFVDGSLGSHTAAFHEPFTDAPGDRGLLVNHARATCYAWIAGRRQGRAARDGARDRRPRQSDCSSTSSSAWRARTAPRDRRFRIEHAQHLAPADIPRFAALGVIASMQPYHAIDDGRWAETVIGQRAIQDDVRVPLAARRRRDGSPSAATGSSRRRRRSRGSTPRSRAARSTTRHPDGWVPGAEDHRRGGAARVHHRRRVRRLRRRHERGMLAARPARRLRPARPRTSRDRAGDHPRRAGRDDGRRRTQGLRTAGGAVSSADPRVPPAAYGIRFDL